MILVDLERYPKPTEGLIQLALADYVQWWRVTCVPNLCLWHEMDFAVLTRAGCVWEFEIKCSQADWNRDNLKDHGATFSQHQLALLERFPPGDGPGHREYQRRMMNRPTRNLTHVSRFYYVYADGLKCPEWVKPDIGLIRVWFERREAYGKRETRVRLTEERPAVSRKVPKIGEKMRAKFFEAAYHRYWKRIKDVKPHEAEPALQDDA